MDNFFNEDELADLLKEMEESQEADETAEEDDKEMSASQRRYMEIIKKHKPE